jgi:beta-glucosidase
MYKFPDNFIWGAATSAHQTEGNNNNSDWWEWEHNKKPGEIFPLEESGIACDSYNRYEEDFDLCTKLNNNAVRISIEWSRIEPNEGEFDLEAIEHYKKVLQAAKDRNLKTFVTLHHFTNPIWLSKKGGWHSFGSPKYFERYAKKCAETLGDLIDYYITINEPQVYTFLGYVGVHDWRTNSRIMWPPAKRNLLRALFAQINFIRAHNKAYKIIKSVAGETAEVGLVKNLTYWEVDPYGANAVDKTATSILNFMGRDLFLRPIKKYLDFIGLNYYFTSRLKNLKIDSPNDYVSDLDWWINPGGIEGLLNHLKGYDLPVYITENGLADENDKYRNQFIRDHLISCHIALSKGVDLRGYFHWSLIDNFEWAQGYWPRFGLVEIDRENNLERKPRPSFYYYADICKNNEVKLEHWADTQEIQEIK